jgi:hypothetical protein
MMLIEIVRHTPLWVFAIFAALVVLGLRQTRSRQVARGVLVAVPCAMAVWSVSSLVQGFAAAGLVAWVASYAACIAIARSIGPRSDVQYSPTTRSFAIPGSRLPLILMMTIFFTRYAIGVAVAMQPARAESTGFATIVGLASGFVAGAFAARAIRIGLAARARPSVVGVPGSLA